jgi:hypothetical protein
MLCVRYRTFSRQNVFIDMSGSQQSDRPRLRSVVGELFRGVELAIGRFVSSITVMDGDRCVSAAT